MKFHGCFFDETLVYRLAWGGVNFACRFCLLVGPTNEVLVLRLGFERFRVGKRRQRTSWTDDVEKCRENRR